MQNTTPDKPKREVERVPRFQPPRNIDNKLSENVAQLSQQLVNERDGRMEERFHWILVAAILFDCAMFPHIPVWLALPLFMLELCIAPGLAKRCGVDWAVKGLEQARRWFEERLKKGRDDSTGQD